MLWLSYQITWDGFLARQQDSFGPCVVTCNGIQLFLSSQLRLVLLSASQGFYKRHEIFYSHLHRIGGAYRRPSSSARPPWRRSRLFNLLLTIFLACIAFLVMCVPIIQIAAPISSFARDTFACKSHQKFSFSNCNKLDSSLIAVIQQRFFKLATGNWGTFCQFFLGKTSSQTRQWRVVYKVLSCSTMMRNFPYDIFCSRTQALAFVSKALCILSTISAQILLPKICQSPTLSFTLVKSSQEVFVKSERATPVPRSWKP